MKVRSLRLLEEQQTYEIISARDIGNGIIHLILKGVIDNVKFMCLLFRDLCPVSKGRAAKRQGSRFTIKVLRHNFLRKQSAYRDLWQAVYANSRKRQTVCRRPRYLYRNKKQCNKTIWKRLRLFPRNAATIAVQYRLTPTSTTPTCIAPTNTSHVTSRSNPLRNTNVPISTWRPS